MSEIVMGEWKGYVDSLNWCDERLSRPVFGHSYSDGEKLHQFAALLGNRIGIRVNSQLKVLGNLLLDLYLRHVLTNGKSNIGVFTGNTPLADVNSAQFKMLGGGSKPVAACVRALNKSGYIVHKKGIPKHSTKIKATSRLAAEMSEAGFCLVNYRTRDIYPIGYTENPKDEDEATEKRFVRIEGDLAKKHGLIELQAYNKLIRKSSVRVGNSYLYAFEKQVRRRFSDPKASGNGRLYGPIWQTLPRRARGKIVIDDMPTCEIDISSTHPAIAYSQRGIDLTEVIRIEGKPYQLHGIHSTRRHTREILKQALLIMFNANDRTSAQKGLQGWINGERDAVTNKKEIYAEWKRLQEDYGLSIGGLFDRILLKHEPISDLFFQSGWKWLNWIESDICMDVVKDFTKKVVPILPIHDSFICPVNHKEELEEVLLDSLKTHLGLKFAYPEYLFEEKAIDNNVTNYDADQMLLRTRMYREKYKKQKEGERSEN